MSLDNVIEILKSYDDKKGVGRKLLGDHNAIKDLRKFYIKTITPAKPSPFPSSIPKLYYEKKEPLPTSTQTTWFHNFVKEYEFKTNDKGAAYDCFKELKIKCAQHLYNLAEKTNQWTDYNKVLQMCSFKEIGKEFPVLFNCKITNDARKKMEKAHRIYWKPEKREVKMIQPYVSTYVPPILSTEEIQHREKLELLKKIESNTYCIRTGQYYDYRGY